eukprot:scaffold2125_cov126-Cylindrotheca_fusiformis.AAC.6
MASQRYSCLTVEKGIELGGMKLVAGGRIDCWVQYVPQQLRKLLLDAASKMHDPIDAILKDYKEEPRCWSELQRIPFDAAVLVMNPLVSLMESYTP